jgi:uncharacterized protein YdbL (DUF1318 family)
MIAALLLVLGVMGMCCVTAQAATKEELRARFKDRYPQIQQLKTDGKIGETSAGYVEAVKPEFAKDQAVKQLVDQENADRRELYQLLAKDTGTTAGQVAKNNAVRNFERAKSGEWLKGDDGAWKKKA